MRNNWQHWVNLYWKICAWSISTSILSSCCTWPCFLATRGREEENGSYILFLATAELQTPARISWSAEILCGCGSVCSDRTWRGLVPGWSSEKNQEAVPSGLELCYTSSWTTVLSPSTTRDFCCCCPKAPSPKSPPELPKRVYSHFSSKRPNFQIRNLWLFLLPLRCRGSFLSTNCRIVHGYDPDTSC